MIKWRNIATTVMSHSSLHKLNFSLDPSCCLLGPVIYLSLLTCFSWFQNTLMRLRRLAHKLYHDNQYCYSRASSPSPGAMSSGSANMRRQAPSLPNRPAPGPPSRSAPSIPARPGSSMPQNAAGGLPPPLIPTYVYNLNLKTLLKGDIYIVYIQKIVKTGVHSHSLSCQTILGRC